MNKIKPGPCHMHKSRQRGEGKLCKVETCQSKPYGKGYCAKHYERFRTHGDPLYEWVIPKGPRHHQWREGHYAYGAAHNRVRSARGPAKQYQCCSPGCDKPAREWAYDHRDPDAKVGIVRGMELLYSDMIDHYQPMCVSCHRQMDNQYRENRA